MALVPAGTGTLEKQQLAVAQPQRPAVIGRSAPPLGNPVVVRAYDFGQSAKAAKRRAKRGRNSIANTATAAGVMASYKSDTYKYLESILHPERQLPVGIPDHFSYPFCPMSLVSKFPLTSDAFGNALILIQPSIAAQLTNYTSNGVGQWIGPPGFANASQTASVAAAIRSYRPVSMSATFTSTLPALTAQGEAMVGVSGDPTTVFSFSPVANVQQACSEWERCGLNISPGCRAIWFPRSPKDRDYRNVTALPIQEGAVEGSGGTSQVGSSNLVFAFTGILPTTAYGFVEVTLNIEGIPLLGDNFLTKQRTSVNTQEIDLVGNVMSTASQITNYEAGKAKERTTSSVENLLNYLESGVSTAAKAASILSRLPVW